MKTVNNIDSEYSLKESSSHDTRITMTLFPYDAEPHRMYMYNNKVEYRQNRTNLQDKQEKHN
jgi:hypothetical protein